MKKYFKKIEINNLDVIIEKVSNLISGTIPDQSIVDPPEKVVEVDQIELMSPTLLYVNAPHNVVIDNILDQPRISIAFRLGRGFNYEL